MAFVLLGFLTGYAVLQLSIWYPISWPVSVVAIAALACGAFRWPRGRIYFLTALPLCVFGLAYGAGLWLVLGGFG